MYVYMYFYVYYMCSEIITDFYDLYHLLNSIII